MASEITFKFLSEAPYSAEELKHLKGEIASTVMEIDEDFVENSTSISLTDPSDVEANATAEQARIDALVEIAVQDVLKSAVVNVTTSITDVDGNPIFKNKSVGDNEL